MSRHALTAILAVAAVAVTGCGISDPDAPPPPTTTAAAALEQPSRRVSTPPSPAASYGERGLLARFARAWFTYTFSALPAQQRELAGLATGALAQQLARNGEADLQAQYIRVTSIRSHGEVEAIVVRPHAAIVVTREALTTNGQTQTAWDIYLATVANTTAGLRVATWTPANG